MILSVVGARPQFIKAAIVSKALKEYGIKELIVHTGQHYDFMMSEIFWKELELCKAKYNLGIGSGSQGYQTARMIEKLEEFVINLKIKPKAVLVYGDTNSTLAGALVAAKLNIKIIHVEAGLRSFNRKMPEEINRIVTDRISDFLFCSSKTGVEQLMTEGINKNVYNVGDVMYDAILHFSKILNNKNMMDSALLPNGYVLLTLHRPVNTDNLKNIKSIFAAIKNIDKTVYWPVHPRNKALLKKLDIPVNLMLSGPKSYLEMIKLIKNSYKIITDSGGLQKEAYWLKKPCITLREETEWVETLHNNWNILTGAKTNKILKAYSEIIDFSTWRKLYGNGNASKKIAKILKNKLDL